MFLVRPSIFQARNARPHKTHDFILELLPELSSTMRGLASEALLTFGAGFAKYVVPTFEKGVEQLSSTFRKADLLDLKASVAGSQTLEEANDMLTCVCIAGNLLCLVDEVNLFLAEAHNGAGRPLDSAQPVSIRNRQSLERFAKRVVQQKVLSLARILVGPMNEEMNSLVGAGGVRTRRVTSEAADRRGRRAGGTAQLQHRAAQLHHDGRARAAQPDEQHRRLQHRPQLQGGGADGGRRRSER